MKLSEYLNKNGLNAMDLVDKLKVSRATLHYWLREDGKKKIPGRDHMALITDFTKGQVTANDFYE